ncbi:MAG TPA: ATP phosphoribosyltransferase regulatory subunit, partial [Phycisphaerae bacterium]|nr:ATP phosphoribosyltransferase regulatory subunit [Phycisphaerae bacterium]
EGPIFEYLDLYTVKSGAGIVSELFHFTDRGERQFALRPEMTPTLARMVAAKINAIPKPIKWFCISNLFRGENVQRGRLREFYQWNVDVIGSPSMVADGEVILCGVESLRSLGLTAADFSVHISNRNLVRSILLAAGINEEGHGGAYALMDKAAKLPREELARRWGEAYGKQLAFDTLDSLMDAGSLTDLRAAVARVGPATSELDKAIADTQELFSILQNFGISEFCQLDLHVVRGLAYYTGPVFEFYDRSEKERAICGGGRYDDLLGKLGKSGEPAVGFGMGDVVLSLIMEEKRLLGGAARTVDVFVADAAGGQERIVQQVVAALRRGGYAAEFEYRPGALGKQLKSADKLGAKQVVIVGSETDRAKIKDMAGGLERDIALAALITNPREHLTGRS